MKIIIKKTNELTENEMSQICDLFYNVFNKEKKIDDFKRQFLKTHMGYSYHSIIEVDSKIVGINSIIPYKYNFFGNEKLFALSVDTMIKKEYRSLSLFTQMTKAVYKLAQEDGVSLVFGFPNDVSYKIFKKMFKWRDIDKLDFYILPIKIGKFKEKLKFLNPISLMMSNIVNQFIASPKKGSHYKFNIEKIADDVFVSQRYSKEHCIVSNDFYTYTYKIESKDDMEVAYLIDVIPLNKNYLENSIKAIYNENKGSIDAILYVGKLNFSPLNLIKVPQRFQPKMVYMSGLVFENDEKLNDIFNIKNWNVNLSNHDVI